MAVKDLLRDYLEWDCDETRTFTNLWAQKAKIVRMLKSK